MLFDKLVHFCTGNLSIPRFLCYVFGYFQDQVLQLGHHLGKPISWPFNIGSGGSTTVRAENLAA